jgi:hypothetical protein
MGAAERSDFGHFSRKHFWFPIQLQSRGSEPIPHLVKINIARPVRIHNEKLLFIKSFESVEGVADSFVITSIKVFVPWEWSELDGNLSVFGSKQKPMIAHGTFQYRLKNTVVLLSCIGPLWKSLPERECNRFG